MHRGERLPGGVTSPSSCEREMVPAEDFAMQPIEIRSARSARL